MCDAKGVPEHNICIINGFVAVLSDPFGQALRGLARGLGDVSASRVDLVVLIYMIYRLAAVEVDIFYVAYIWLHGQHALRTLPASRPTHLPLAIK